MAFAYHYLSAACTAGFTMSAFTGQNFGAKEYGRIRQGLMVCLSIAMVSYFMLGSVMVLFPETLAKLMLTGEQPIALTAEFLPICGCMIFAVDILFVFRNGVQGMGYPMIPMYSGIVEMVVRIGVIVLLMPRIGFRATAYAEVVAWFSALSLNMSGFLYLLHKKSKENF